MTESGNQIQS